MRSVPAAERPALAAEGYAAPDAQRDHQPNPYWW
jgi:hypothetical protein